MENSSPSQTLQDSPIVFPPDSFRWGRTVAFILGAAVMFLILVLVIGVAWGISQHLDMYGTAHALTGMAGVIIQSLAEVIVIAYIVALLPLVARMPLHALGLRRLTAEHIGIIVIGAIAMFVVVTPLASALQTLLHFKTPEEAIAVFSKTSGWQRVVFAFFGIVLAPLFEESIFRWTLFNAMRRWWGLWPGAIVSSILFGLAHSQPPFTPAMLVCITFPLAVGGVILCLVYNKTNNAWASFLTHGLFNGFSLALLALFPQLAK
ncbi:MAG TPA: type II CAAX endopeptidase family protein [Candidatus Baltobacteraceae bacterium]|nr:type II CAAX endopeptidase family protein [Candidatus Baltobacteraceae bacterium]